MGHDIRKERLREELRDVLESSATVKEFIDALALKISSHADSEDAVRDIAAWLDSHSREISEHLR